MIIFLCVSIETLSNKVKRKKYKILYKPSKFYYSTIFKMALP